MCQCAIPSFDGLFEKQEYNDMVLDLLYVMAYFHGLEKMRLHTQTTLQAVKLATPALGDELRRFKSDMADKIETKETPREKQARARRAARLASKTGRAAPAGSSEARPKKLNLNTLKVHRLGHVAANIEEHGSLDSVDCRIVSVVPCPRRGLLTCLLGGGGTQTSKKSVSTGRQGRKRSSSRENRHHSDATGDSK
jgi:hypothetical protein